MDGVAQYVLERYFNEGSLKKIYDLDELECFWTTEDDKSVLVIRPKENLKELRRSAEPSVERAAISESNRDFRCYDNTI